GLGLVLRRGEFLDVLFEDPEGLDLLLAADAELIERVAQRRGGRRRQAGDPAELEDRGAKVRGFLDGSAQELRHASDAGAQADEPERPRDQPAEGGPGAPEG